MTMELKEVGLDVGERRVGRLMKINGIKPVRTRKHKVTTDSNHRLGVAANWLDGDFAVDVPNRKWAGDITYIWTSEGWLYPARRAAAQLGNLRAPDVAPALPRSLFATSATGARHNGSITRAWVGSSIVVNIAISMVVRSLSSIVDPQSGNGRPARRKPAASASAAEQNQFSGFVRP